MKNLDLNNGAVRAVITFILAFIGLQLLRISLRNAIGFEFYGETVVILIGAGWLAYWIWRKTEFGYY